MATAPNPSTQAEQDFVIARTFDAPRELVWKAWTEPEHLAQWWGPKGCTIRVVKLDLRPGGMFHYAMAVPARATTCGRRFVYREIAPPERIVYVNSFSDAEGGSHPRRPSPAPRRPSRSRS